MKSKWNKVKSAVHHTKVLDELKKPVINPKETGITQSILCGFLKCRRFYYLSLRKWESLEKKLTYANGAITHDMLDKCYTYYSKYGYLPKKTLLIKWINKYDTDNPNWMPNRNTELISKYKMVCFTIVIEYLRYYKDRGEFENNTILGAEDVFDLSHKDVRIRGKKDMRFKNKNGEHWIMETKTMARISMHDIIDRLRLDPQCLLYTMAEEMEFNVKCKGVLYNIVRNPGHKLEASETLSEYCKRIKKEIRKDPKHFFIRHEMPFTNKDKMEFKLELINKVKDMESIALGKSYPYRNETACISPFRCSFLPACSSGNLNGYTRTKILYRELL